MPTVLTYEIYDGTSNSLRKFALKCVKHLDYGYYHYASNDGENDLPLDNPPVMVPDDYYLRRKHDAETELEYWLKVKENLEETERLYEEACLDVYNDQFSVKDNSNEIEARYDDMIAKVSRWKPGEQYESLKSMMMKQLRESIKFDCPKRPIPKTLDEIRAEQSAEEWLERNIEWIRDDIERYAKHYEEEVNRCKECNAYLKGLYESLDKFEKENIYGGNKR